MSGKERVQGFGPFPSSFEERNQGGDNDVFGDVNFDMFEKRASETSLDLVDEGRDSIGELSFRSRRSSSLSLTSPTRERRGSQVDEGRYSIAEVSPRFRRSSSLSSHSLTPSFTPLRRASLDSLTSETSELIVTTSDSSPDKAQKGVMRKVARVARRIEKPQSHASFMADLGDAERLLKQIENPINRLVQSAGIDRRAVFAGLPRLTEQRSETIKQERMNPIAKKWRLWKARKDEKIATKRSFFEVVPALLDSIRDGANSSKFSHVEIFPLTTTLKEFAEHKHCPRVTSQYFAGVSDAKERSVPVEEDLTLEMLFKREAVVTKFPHLADDNEAIQDSLKDILYTIKGIYTYVYLGGVTGSDGLYLLEVVTDTKTGALEVAALAIESVNDIIPIEPPSEDLAS